MSDIDVANYTYMITRMIEQAPSDPMMVRELMQNAIEASITAKEPKIRVMKTDPALFGYEEFGYFDKKLAIWNNGTGMAAKDLREAVRFSSSLNKLQRLDQNFGIGSKALSLGVNKSGMIWVSCKNGKVSTVLLKYGRNSKGELAYVRHDFNPKGCTTGYKDVFDITHLQDKWKHLPDKWKWSTNEDWTLIILCGNNPLQNTVENPFKPDHDLKPSWFINSLYRRYFRIPDNIDLRLEVGHSKGNSSSPIKFRPIFDYIQHTKGNWPTQVRDEFVADKDGSGINIWYLYDDEWIGPSKKQNLGKPTSTVGNPATTPGFSAILYKNEMYDVSTDVRWKSIAAKLGILYGAKYLRVVVEIPDSAQIIPDQYRQNLQTPDAEKLSIGILDFASEIRNNMPDWFKAKIKSFVPANVNSNDLQKKAQELLHRLMTEKPRSDLTVPKSTGTIRKRPSSRTGVGAPHSSPVNSTPRMAGDGDQFELTVTIPDLQFIRLPSDLENSSATKLKYMAAEYIEDSAIYINCMYDVVYDVVDTIMLDYQDRTDEEFEKIETEAKIIVSNEMAWLVVKAIAFSMAKKAKIGFDQEEIDKALSNAALTTHADNLIYNIEECSLKLKERVKQLEEGLI